MRTSRIQLVASVAVLALATGMAGAPAVASPASAATGPAPAATSPGSAVASPGTLAAATGFSDVDGTNPFAADITWLADAGITTGYADGTFRPRGSVNRDAMAAFLYRIVVGPDTPAACATGPFTDVGAAHPFCPQITWLVGEEITTGWPDGTYRPAAPVSREAMAAFLYRVANDGADAPACSASPFTDVPAASPFCGEITWLAGHEVTTGWPDGTFRPGASIERQAMAAFLHRFVDKGLVPGDDEPPGPDPDPDPDGIDPQVTIDDPVDGAIVGGEVTARGSWVTYADRARLDLLIDGVVVASADAEPFDLVWDTTGVTDGPHDLTIVGTDSEGRTGTSAPIAVFVHQGPDPLQLLEDHRESGTVTAEDYARYAVFRWFEPDLVPEQYRVPEGYRPSDLTFPMLQVLYGADLDPAVRQDIIDALTPDGPPDLPEGPLTPEQIEAALAPFRADDGSGLAPTLQAAIVPGTVECAIPGSWEPMTMPYDLTQPRSECVYVTDLAVYRWAPGWDDPGTPGIDWPSVMDEQTDEVDFLLRGSSATLGGPNGIPDYLDALHAGLSDAYATYEDLGFGTLSDPLDVFIGDGDSVSYPWGQIYLHYNGDSGGHNPVYAARHELFHQFQYNYIDGPDVLGDFVGLDQSTNGWWLEATAEWAAHQAQQAERGTRARNPYYQNAHRCSSNGAQVPCYSTNLPDHLGDPGQPLTRFVNQLRYSADPQYGSFLFAEWLEVQFDKDIILQTWEAMGAAIFPRAINQIAGVVEDRGATLRDVVEAYHLANWTIPTSYVNPTDPTADHLRWSNALRRGRPGYTQLVAKERPRPMADTLELGPGGAFYLALDLPQSSPGALVQVHLEEVDALLPGSDVTVQAVAFTQDGKACSEYGADPVPLTDEGFDGTATVVPGCPRLVLIVSHNDPGSPDIRYRFSYTVTIEDAAVAGLSPTGAEVEFVGPVRASAVDGLWSYGQLLDEDGYANYWGTAWTIAGSRMAITRVRDSAEVTLGGVRQIQSQCHGADNGWALTDDGRLWSLYDRYYTDMPGFSNVDRLALGWCGLVGYLVHRNGSLTYVNANTPAADDGPVTGAADVTDVTVWASDDPTWGHGYAGYAITGDRELLYLDTTTAVPVPGVDDVAAVSANSSGTAYVRHRDGTVVVFSIDAPLVAKPAAGIPSAREIVAPFEANQGYVLTDTDRLFVIQCGGTACSEVTVLDSGLTGVDTVTAVENATAMRPAWVLLHSGELVELYVDDTGVHTTSTGLTDVVDMAIATAQDKYSVHADGTVSTWERLFEAGWGPRQEVAHVTNADEVLCTHLRCFVNLD